MKALKRSYICFTSVEKPSILICILGILLILTTSYGFTNGSLVNETVDKPLHPIAKTGPSPNIITRPLPNSFRKFNQALDNSGDFEVTLPSRSTKMFNDISRLNRDLVDGRINRSINLYEIDLGDFKMPINITYNNSGIKYGQANGEVGVGWVLEAGHRISRSIHGRPDEHYDKPSETGVPTWPTFSSEIAKENYLANFISNGAATHPVLPSPTNYWDGEYDIFNYTYPTGSGVFLITDRVNNTISKLTADQSKINFYRKPSSKAVDYFSIVDETGHTMRYGKSSLTGQYYEEKLNEGSVPISPTAWLLTEINDQYRNLISFQYASYFERDNKDFDEHTILDGGNNAQMVQISLPSSSEGLGSNPLANRYYVQYVTQITSLKENITFIRDSEDGKVTRIDIKNLLGKVLRKIDFEYVSNAKHKFLSKINIYDGANKLEDSYTFDYYNKVDNANYMPDYWGYYKLVTNGFSILPDFGEVIYWQWNGYSLGYYKVDAYLTEMNLKNRNSDLLPNYFMLKSIRYPSGAVEEIEYEANEYWAYRDDSYSEAKKQAGVRVKRVQIKDNNIIKNSTLYKYGYNEDGLGNVRIDIAEKNYFMKEYRYLVQTNVVTPASFNYRKYSSEILSELSMVQGDPLPVKYEYITVYNQDSSGDTEIKSRFTYDINEPYSNANFSTNTNYDTDSYGFPSVSRYSIPFLGFNYGANGPQLIEKIEYKLEGTQYIPSVKESWTYGIEDLKNYYGLKVREYTLGLNYNTKSLLSARY